MQAGRRSLLLRAREAAASDSLALLNDSLDIHGAENAAENVAGEGAENVAGARERAGNVAGERAGNDAGARKMGDNVAGGGGNGEGRVGGEAMRRAGTACIRT